MSKSKDKDPKSDDMDNQVTLKHPFTTAEGNLLSHVNLTAIQVREMNKARKQAGNDSIDVEIATLSESCGVAEADIDEMHLSDYYAVIDKFKELNVGDPEEDAKASPHKYTLKHKFTTGAGAPINQLNVRGIKVREMKQAQRRGDGNSTDTECAMIAVACDLLMEDLDNMYMIDYNAVSARFSILNSDTSEPVADDAGTTSEVVSHSAE